MPIDYPAVLALKQEGLRFSYTDRDAMLYALGVGLGADPLDRRELPFVYEKELRALPTFATVIAWGAGVSTAEIGLNQRLVLHGEEETILHRPLAPSGSIISNSGIVEVYDKGKEKGAIIVRRTDLFDANDGAPVATLYRSLFARGDGGNGGSSAPAPEPHAIPDRAPDMILRYATRPDQALIYRLCGDRTALHADPDMAAAAGFDAPILHGLCTYGICGRAVLEAYCDFDPVRVASHRARFSSPVYPGDTLEVALWRDGEVISFEASVPARGVKVLRNGRSQLRPAA